MLLSRRQFIEGVLAFLMTSRLPRGRTEPTPMPVTVPIPQRWAFAGGGLSFPAYFITEEEKRRMRMQYRSYLPIVGRDG